MPFHDISTHLRIYDEIYLFFGLKSNLAPYVVAFLHLATVLDASVNNEAGDAQSPSLIAFKQASGLVVPPLGNT